MSESPFVDLLNQARAKLYAVYPMDDLDKKALDEVKVALAKTVNHVTKLEDDNYKLREFISRNIS